MCKKIYKFNVIASAICAVAMASGCSDQFLKDKTAYGKTTAEVYNDYEGSVARIDYLYSVLLPSSNTDVTYLQPSNGTADVFAKCTEEYGGLASYVDPNVIITNTTNLDDFIYRENKTSSPYGRIRECNDIIEGVTAGSLSDDQKEELLGQAYFFRAWCYYQLVKIYGGIPIVDYVQNPLVGDDGGASLIIPRSTTKECIDFICSDLEKAASYLPSKWESTTEDFGRVTAGTALAVEGRARLLYASPLFNRADNTDRWQLAYDANKSAITKLTEGGFGLAYLNDPGTNASGWAKMFSEVYNSLTSSEAVFVTLYNNLEATAGTNYYKNNGWEQSIRPYNAGGGGRATTAQMVDLFPMADGLKPSESSYTYNSSLFFLNRDPRFYRTFAFPGVRWAFNGDPTAKSTGSSVVYPYSGSNYVLWSYAWYATASNQAADNQSGFGADGLGTNNKSVYVRKRTDDYDVNSASLYNYDTSNGTSFFAWSAAPYMEIRYAEVLLNFAEAACGIGNYTEAVDAVIQIRKRAGYSDTALETYRAKLLGMGRGDLFGAILYERQIEFAYEGKRYDDMRRWMLWDGGQGQESLNASWKLSGYNGNTCTYVGFTPLNGTRRNGIVIQVAESLGQAEEAIGKDPVVVQGITRPTALNLMSDVVTAKTDEIATDQTIDKLATFYSNYLNRKTTRVDGDTRYTISFQPQYYFLGFKDNMQKANITLKQTIGWGDYANGGANGTYDPLAE